MEHELKKLKLSLNLYETFFCAFIVIDDIDKIDTLKEELNQQVNFVNDCYTIDDLKKIKDRVLYGEKIILYNLNELYDQFSKYDIYQNGIFHFYQRFTEAYRDRLWNNSNGQLYFVLIREELEQYYDVNHKRHNHFSTMCMTTFDFSRNKVKKNKS